MQEGVLPEDMVPDHNDEDFPSDGEYDPLVEAALQDQQDVQDVKIDDKLTGIAAQSFPNSG